MQEDYSKEVKQAIAETLGLDIKDIKEDASFNEDLGADSLDVVELIMGFESKFNISIPDEDAVTLTTVQQAIDYVNERSLKS